MGTRYLGSGGATNRAADEVSIGGMTAGRLQLDYQARTVLSLTTSDQTVAIPDWATYAQVRADVAFVAAAGVATSATVGAVYDDGTWLIPIVRSGTNNLHLRGLEAGAADATSVTFLGD